MIGAVLGAVPVLKPELGLDRLRPLIRERDDAHARVGLAGAEDDLHPVHGDLCREPDGEGGQTDEARQDPESPGGPPERASGYRGTTGSGHGALRVNFTPRADEPVTSPAQESSVL